MSSLSDDIARGCLENGEPIEAKWGSGWWSCQDQQPEPDPWSGAECPKCGNMLHTFWDNFAEDCVCGEKLINTPVQRNPDGSIPF